MRGGHPALARTSVLRTRKISLQQHMGFLHGFHYFRLALAPGEVKVRPAHKACFHS